MARYRHYDYSQGKFIPIQFDRQILPGTFEYTLHYLIDNEIDLSIFELRYENDKKELAKEIHVPYLRINEIINKRRGVTPSTALRLAKFFGVSEDFWMNLQLRSDIYSPSSMRKCNTWRNSLIAGTLGGHGKRIQAHQFRGEG